MDKKTILVVDALLHLRPQNGICLDKELLPGKDTATLLAERLSMLQGFSGKFIFAPEDTEAASVAPLEAAGFLTVKSTTLDNEAQLLKMLSTKAKETGADRVALVWFDSPFLEPSICKDVLDLMEKNDCEYAFADNLPDGLALECMSAAFLEDISKLNPKKPELLSRKVFDNMDADINQYYVEVWLPEEDISLKRIEFHSNTLRNLALLERILKIKQAVPSYRELVDLIRTSPEVLYGYPKFLEMEITTDRDDQPVYLPKSSREKGMMDFALFQKILDEVTSEYDDIILSLAGEGDPLKHPQIINFVDYALGKTKLQSLILETSGLTLTDEMVRSFSVYMPSKLQIIFKIDAAKDQTYQLLRNSSLPRLKDNLDRFFKASEQNKYRSFVQFTKLKENLDEMEDFFRTWDSKGIQVIIQKYDSFAGQLENRTVADLSPLDRLPCWHLLRDLFIFHDGRVPFCKADFNAKHIVGNLRNENILSLREKILPVYVANAKEDFTSYPFCSTCDEWYTYNF